MRKGTKHVLSTDTTKFSGGTDKNPEPVYMLLSSLSGCLTATTDYVAKNLDEPVPIMSMDISIEAWRDQREVIKKPITDPEVSTALKEIRGKVQLRLPRRSALPPERLEELSSIVENRCPISALLASSSCLVELDWSVLPSPKKVNIYGGGLAGLSTSYWLLNSDPDLDITIHSGNELTTHCIHSGIAF